MYEICNNNIFFSDIDYVMKINSTKYTVKVKNDCIVYIFCNMKFTYSFKSIFFVFLKKNV